MQTYGTKAGQRMPRGECCPANVRLLPGVRCCAREVKGHTRFVAHDPRIVSRWNIERVVGADVHFRAIGHDPMHAPGEAIARMLRLPAVRLGDWLDAFG